MAPRTQTTHTADHTADTLLTHCWHTADTLLTHCWHTADTHKQTNKQTNKQTKPWTELRTMSKKVTATILTPMEDCRTQIPECAKHNVTQVAALLNTMWWGCASKRHAGKKVSSVKGLQVRKQDYGGVLSHGSISNSSISWWDFPWNKPSIHLGTSIYGNPSIFVRYPQKVNAVEGHTGTRSKKWGGDNRYGRETIIKYQK